jgi:superfamily II DNA or RNA helicase
MGLKDYHWKPQYRSNQSGDITENFYVPCLKEAVLYWRSVGFFSSTALERIMYGIDHLVLNNGKIRLIVSPKLSLEDIEAIQEGYYQRSKGVENSILAWFNQEFDIYDKVRLNILAKLVAQGRLDIKVALTENLGMYHEKLGVMQDISDDFIAFSGSMNESETAFMYNFESVEVYCSWEEAKRARLTYDNFIELWNGATQGLFVLDFPEVGYERLKKYNKDSMSFQESFKFLERKKGLPQLPQEISGHQFELRKYQEEAINAWLENNGVGLFSMATGTGKTLTAISAATKLYEKKKRLAIIIVCPFQHLVDQWEKDLRHFNFKPICAYESSLKWQPKLKSKIRYYNLGSVDYLCVITTNATFSGEKFLKQIEGIKDEALLIVDEAHNIGSTTGLKALNRVQSTMNYRLALSATPSRHFDEEGTEKLIQYFGRVVYEFSLERAIREHHLTPYNYHIIATNLNDEEYSEYINLSREIRSCIFSKDGKLVITEKAKRLMLQRSRLVNTSKDKLIKLIEKLKEDDLTYQNLVYCGVGKDDDGLRQINLVTKALTNKVGMRVSQFTAEEPRDERQRLIARLSTGDDLHALIAMKCLDEGVDIPCVQTAYIMASSTNKKEHIQRRGRVLRKFPGKVYATIYDFITLPRTLEDIEFVMEDNIIYEKALITRELDRINEFSKLSRNPGDHFDLIWKLQDFYGIIFDDGEEV